jgi:hypothetical protein
LHWIRRAAEQDIARIVESRAGVSENALSDPSKVTLEDIRWFIVNPRILVWEDGNGNAEIIRLRRYLADDGSRNESRAPLSSRRVAA